jgi:hypothetical protein
VVDFRIISINTKELKTEIINQPPRPQINFAINKSALYCGHPSFKRRGNVSGIYSILYLIFAINYLTILLYKTP